jgi:hypothetical protein
LPGYAEEDERFADQGSSIAHDDIMKRLLAYQRQLRGDLGALGPEALSRPGVGEAPEIPSAATATDELVDLGFADGEALAAPVGSTHREIGTPPAAEPWPEAPSSGAAVGELERRVADLESTLEGLDAMLSDLRRRFRELAVAADEQIAQIRAAASRARGEDEST